jgi:2-polyprenyl-6-hydroxyphenyl methylase/3-demethylubiquinone-9 3-methyltransferase
MTDQLSMVAERNDMFHARGVPHTFNYLMPALLKLLPPPCSVFEIGCGNGSTAKALIERGYLVRGIDPSESGIALAKEYGDFQRRSVYEDLSSFGRFDVVLSLEVIEHLTNPRAFVHAISGLISPGGVAIISTPYHGYMKNLMLSLLNKWDTHLDPLWEGGHIKLWSRTTLKTLFEEFDFYETAFVPIGRVPPLAKSMVVRFAKAGNNQIGYQ